MPRFGTPLVVLAALAGAATAAAADLPPAANRSIDFARDIQPILEKSCLECHGSEKPKADFSLVSRAAALQGSANGPVIVTGDSARSRLIQLVAGLDPKLVMPKKGDRLSPEQVGLLRAWIDQGLPYEKSFETAHAPKVHWAFLAPPKPEPPGRGTLKRREWVRNPIDQFILARLEQEKMFPAPEADRAALIRRVSFDLTGLPPTPEEIDAFAADPHPLAYEHLVDRLLSSPHYGERWGRHWLDVVHFGETHGYDKDKPRLNAWPYRDYVIRAFNADKPYSRFVQEQLAGDILFPESPEGTAATGFISAGPWDFVGHVELPESKTDGLIARYNDRDDMVMTTMSTFQSLTVHCARCHNHKFDPIKQEDYYRLQAVFAGVDRADHPYDPDPAIHQKRRVLASEIRELESKIARIRAEAESVSTPETRNLGEKIAASKRELEKLREMRKGQASPANGYHSGIESQAEATKWVQVDLGQTASISEIRLVPARPVDYPDTPGFGFPARFRVEVSDTADFSASRVCVDHTAADYPNPGDTAFVATKPVQGRYVRVTATRLWKRMNDFVFALAELQVISDGKNIAAGRSVTSLDSIEAGRWSRSRLVDGFSSRARLDEASESKTDLAALEESFKGEMARHEEMLRSGLPRQRRAELSSAESALTQAQHDLKNLPAQALIYSGTSRFQATGNFHPAGKPRTVSLLRRGDVKSPVKEVSAGALSCLPGLPSQFTLEHPDDEGSRRAALAKWITHPANLLTRRSIVNRIWQYHFGRGIVDSPNDFGKMGSLPTHPELLDWLARSFQENGESIKWLHRLILTSATYRQSTRPDSENSKRDADNRLLWRMNRIRLDAEEVHDAILSITGKLDPAMGGPSVQQFFFKDDHSPVYDYTRFDISAPGAYRRSIYRFIVRSVPDPWMETLDCPDPSILTPKRNTTLTALQALSLMNNPFVIRQAEVLAARAASGNATVDGQVDRLFRLALGRHPSTPEARQWSDYTRRFGLVNSSRLIINSNEFIFID